MTVKTAKKAKEASPPKHKTPQRRNKRTRLPEAVISTDGSAKPNSPNGTWGAVIHIKGPNGKIVSTKELSGIRYGDKARPMQGASMELYAAIQALESLDGPHKVQLRTDCVYVSNGLNCKRVRHWAANGWRTNSKLPCTCDIPLWKKLAHAAEKHDIAWVHVNGHSGDPDNMRADELCRKAWNNVRDS